jgi:hypothetical protein
MYRTNNPQFVDSRRIGVAVIASIALTAAVICVVSKDASESTLQAVKPQAMIARRFAAPTQPAAGLEAELRENVALDHEVDTFLQKYPTPQQRAMERMPQVQKQQMAAMMNQPPVQNQQAARTMAPPSGMLVQENPCDGDPGFVYEKNGEEHYNPDPAFKDGEKDPVFNPCSVAPTINGESLGTAQAQVYTKMIDRAVGGPPSPPSQDDEDEDGDDVAPAPPLLPVVHMNYDEMNAAYGDDPTSIQPEGPAPAPAPAPFPSTSVHDSVVLVPPPPPSPPATPPAPAANPPAPPTTPTPPTAPPPPVGNTGAETPAQVNSQDSNQPLEDPAFETGEKHGHDVYENDDAFEHTDADGDQSEDQDPDFANDEDNKDATMMATSKIKTQTTQTQEPVDLAKQAMAAHKADTSKKIAALKAATHIKEIKYKKAMAVVTKAGLTADALTQ